MDRETLTVHQIAPGLASTLLAGCDVLDPQGRSTPQTVRAMCERSTCWAASNADGTASAVWAIQKNGMNAWISAARGTGAIPWADLLFMAIEQQCQGLEIIGFQTARRGLVRQAKRHGWAVSGWIMKKDMRP